MAFVSIFFFFSKLLWSRPEVEPSKLDAVADDDMSPEEILAQVQEVAQKAKNDLTTRKPKTDVSVKLNVIIFIFCGSQSRQEDGICMLVCMLVMMLMSLFFLLYSFLC